MKKTFFAVAFTAFSIASYATDSVGVVARQRWPFSPLVDIDVKLEASACTDIGLTATYDGATEPIDLSMGLVEGSTTLLPGITHLVWDPVAAGLGENQLKGFTITSTLIGFDARKYLVFDLKERDYAYYADDPDGKNWSDDKYKQRYLVFRRVPAGVYQLGYTPEMQARWQTLGASASVDVNSTERHITITRDYYIGLYLLTGAQANAISWHSEKGSGGVNGYYYNDSYVTSLGFTTGVPKYWRGAINDFSAGCTWPQNGHAVAMPVTEQTTGKSSGSLVGRFRQLMKNGNHDLPPNMVIDLPTATQWEVAVRAGTTTFYSDCGTITDEKQVIRDYQDAHSTNRNVNVGLMLPTRWDLYDTSGPAYEMSLDVVSSDSDKGNLDTVQCWVAEQLVDPVGFTCTEPEKMYAVTCSCGWGPRSIAWSALPSARRAYKVTTTSTVAARLCIHLK